MRLAESDTRNASILIVDDHEVNVSLLEQMLHEAGYTCVASTMNPHEVCALHRKNRYDLILLDLQMPGMGGFEVMEGLKTNDTDGYLPVLVITAQPGHKLRALQNAILTSANFSIIATDEKGIIQLFNVGAERMLGYMAAEAEKA